MPGEGPGPALRRRRGAGRRPAPVPGRRADPGPARRRASERGLALVPPQSGPGGGRRTGRGHTGATIALGVGSVFALRLSHEQAHQQPRCGRPNGRRRAWDQSNRRRGAALKQAEHFRGLAERASADLALERGLTLLEQGEVGHGMLWLTRSLEITPANAADLQRTIRTNLAATHRQLGHRLGMVLEEGSRRAVPLPRLKFAGDRRGWPLRRLARSMPSP